MERLEINKTVREASIEWVSLAIQRVDPGERQPRQLAEELLSIIEDTEVTVEELIDRFIEEHRGNAAISARECREWALLLPTAKNAREESSGA